MGILKLLKVVYLFVFRGILIPKNLLYFQFFGLLYILQCAVAGLNLAQPVGRSGGGGGDGRVAAKN